MELSGEQRRRAFAGWLRTGRWPRVRTADGLELKFNPYHDPENGRFTSGPASTGAKASEPFRRAIRAEGQNASLVSSGGEPEPARGSNIRAFEDPMTLEQTFPRLRGSPGGAVFAVADNVLDLTGPANEFTREVLQDQSRRLTAEIRAIDPTWHYDEIVPTDAFGTPTPTIQGLTSKVHDLRFHRAAVIARVKGDYGPLQVETLRFVQQQTDDAYDQGMALLKAGRLTPRLSDREAVGNYIDRRVRLDLRERYNQVGIEAAGAGPVRVNRRENDSSATDLTYRLPDARVHDVAFDMTLTQKTLRTAQIRGFFNSDFRPSRVVIIRPRQIGVHHTYVISRPETKR